MRMRCTRDEDAEECDDDVEEVDEEVEDCSWTMAASVPPLMYSLHTQNSFDTAWDCAFPPAAA